MQYYDRLLALAGGVLLLLVPKISIGKPDLDIELHANTYYTSNLYHVSDKREDQFDSKDGPGERFHDMEGPDDIVTCVGFAIGWQREVAEKRDLALSLGTDYSLHARNSIANYFEINGALTYDLTRNDTVRLKAAFIPDRFRKNLSLEDPDTGAKTFARADYQQIDVSPRYLHEWNKDWSTGVEYEYSQREYDDPFGNRDRDCHSLAAIVGYEGLTRTDILLTAGFCTAETPTDVEFGIETDRSYEDWFAELEVKFDLPHHWEAEVGVEYRNRAYTTDVKADDAHYDRTDDLWAFDVEVGRQIRKNIYAGLQLGWARNDSDRTDDTVESDEVGWEEYRVGLVAEWTF
jgi:outer membrane protein assembly factor BamA